MTITHLRQESLSICLYIGWGTLSSKGSAGDDVTFSVSMASRRHPVSYSGFPFPKVISFPKIVFHHFVIECIASQTH